MLDSEKGKLQRVASIISCWFNLNKREFPWRENTSSLYEEIVVEILLQRTKAEAVASLYRDFFDRFPDWGALHSTPIEEIQQFLKPLGIWRRRSITLKNLSMSMVELNGVFPSTREEIDDLPGVGQYIGNAVELFAHGSPMPLLDTNMARVMERVFRSRKLADIRYDPWLQEICKEVVSAGDPVTINWALLDVGRGFCKPKNPICQECPLSSCCNFFNRRDRGLAP